MNKLKSEIDKLNEATRNENWSMVEIHAENIKHLYEGEVDKNTFINDSKCLLYDRNRTHQLKTLPAYFDQIWNDAKNFEVRKNDRGFQKGDKVVLKEFDPDSRNIESFCYTGRKVKAIIGFVLSEYQKNGYVTFSLLKIEKFDT